MFTGKPLFSEYGTTEKNLFPTNIKKYLLGSFFSLQYYGATVG